MPEFTSSYIEICHSCNNDCIFCHCAPDRKEEILSFDKIREYLDKNLRAGSTVTINGGGEPTTHPDFIKIIEYTAVSGAQMGFLLTNGRKFSDYDFALATVQAGLRDFCVPLHGPNKEIHEASSRSPGSFDQTVAGIRNLVRLKKDGYPLRIYIKIVVSRINIKHLYDTVKFIKDEFGRPDVIMLSGLDIAGRSYDNRDALLITLSESAPFLMGAIKVGLESGQNIMLYLIPPCIFPEPTFYYRVLVPPAKQSHNIYSPKKCVEKIDSDSHGAKAESCKECEADELCTGVWRSYLEAVGTHELKPIKTLKPPPLIRR